MSEADKAIITPAAAPSRRSFLRASSAITGALVLSASGAAALPSSPDTPIQRRWREREAMTPELERLEAEESAACERFCNSMPPIPEEMRISEFEAHYTGMRKFASVGRGYDRETHWVRVEGWRHAVERPLVPAEKGPSADVSAVALFRARARKVLPIAERYEAAVDEAREASGKTAVLVASRAAWGRRTAIEDAILSASPETFADLLIQVCVFEGYGMTEGVCDPDEWTFPDRAVWALVRAIKSLGEKTAHLA